MISGKRFVPCIAVAVLSIAGTARATQSQPSSVTVAQAGSKDARPPTAGVPAAGGADLVDRTPADKGAQLQPPVEESGAIPANGVDPLPRRGVWSEAALGVFTTMGGSRALSNGQPYLAMAIGRDLGKIAAIFLQLGIGASSASCFDQAANDTCRAADSFGAFFLEVGGSIGGEIQNRLRIGAKVVVGATQLAPGPVRDGTTNTVPDSLLGFHFGAGGTIDYDTRLDHFAVGIDVIGRYSIAKRPDTGSFGLLSLAAMPRIRYVF